MRVEEFSVSHFRNIDSLKTNFIGGVNIFFGENGSGKTNLLEAVLMLCLGRSQRGAPDNVLLQSDEDVYRLSGSIINDRTSTHVSAAYQRGGRRRHTLDNVPIRTSELYQHFCAVSAGPEDSELIAGPPSVRRAFMDIYLSQFSPVYLADLIDYQRALAQKNAALKNDMDSSLFDPLLIHHGAKVILARRHFTTLLSDHAQRYYHEFSNGESLLVQYSPSVQCDDTDLQSIEHAFDTRLRAFAAKEQILRTALVGPHRDDLSVEIKGFPARTHGSQGQCRTAAIALKLAVYEMLRTRRGVTPLLLLDEIFAELDEGRARALIAAFGAFEQIFLTTALEPPKELGANARRFLIVQGTLQEVN